MATGCKLSVQSSAEVAAADDHDILVAEMVHLAHGVIDRLFLIGIDAVDRRLLGLKRTAARGDQHGLALERLAAVGADPEVRRLAGAQHFERRHHLLEVKGRMEGFDLREKIVDKALAGDHRMAGDVVDRLFRIQLRTLAAGARQNVDEMAFDIEEAEFEDREQTGWTCADDDDVRFDALFHALLPRILSFFTMAHALHLCERGGLSHRLLSMS